MTETLRVDDVSAGYGRQRVLSDVNFVVPVGSVTAVLGPSGCGKTTLLRAIAGLEPISGGRITIAGREVSGDGIHVPPERRDVGLVPQDGALFPHLSVRRNIGFGLRGRAGRTERVDEMLTLVGLEALADRKPAKLSGGQRQRVALARALAPAPSLIALDEPFSALDAALRTRLRADVGHLLTTSGATALLVTHDPAEALALADQIIVLLDGRVRQIGTPQELYAQPVDARVGELFGDLSRISIAGVTHVVRPHELVIGPVHGVATDYCCAVVTDAEYRGSHYVLTVAPSNGDDAISVVVATSDELPEIGTDIAVRLR